MGRSKEDERQDELAVIVSSADGTVVDTNAKARELLGQDGTGACWDVLHGVENSADLPCNHGCVCRLVVAGHENLTSRDVTLRGKPHRMTCVPVDGKVITTITPPTRPKSRDNGVRITRRELDVLRLLAEGLETPEAAKRLGVGVATIRTHVENMRQKLSAKTRAALVAKGFALGYLEAD